MVLDPLNALSVAGTVVQFVDFATKILQQGCLVYKSSTGATEVNEELQLLTEDFLKWTARLQQPSQLLQFAGPPVEHEKELEDICHKCQKFANDFIDRLERLKVKGSHKVWKSLWYALRAAWAEDEINASLKQLATFRDALKARILVGLR